MPEKIKIKAILDCGTPYIVKGTDIVSGIATFVQQTFSHTQLDRLQFFLIQKNAIPKSDTAAEPTPTSNAVLAERIVELDRRLSQYMEVGKNHVESINGLIEEVSRLRSQNADLKESNEASGKQIFELLAEVKALDTGKLDSENVIANFRRRVIHLEDVIKGYENNIHALEQKIALQTSYAASLENQLADKIRDLAVQSDKIKNVTSYISKNWDL